MGTFGRFKIIRATSASYIISRSGPVKWPINAWDFYIVTHIRGPTIRKLSSWQFPKYVGFPPCPAWIEKKKNILVKDPITVGCHRKTPHPMRSTRDMTMTELASAFNLSSSTTLKFFDRNWTYWCSGECLLFRSVNLDVCMYNRDGGLVQTGDPIRFWWTVTFV